MTERVRLRRSRPGNELVIETVPRLAVPCVRGNHDEINDVELAPASRRFLQELPEFILEHDVLFTHISPRPRERKINHAIDGPVLPLDHAQGGRTVEHL